MQSGEKMEGAIQSEISSSSCRTDERMREYREAVASAQVDCCSRVTLTYSIAGGSWQTGGPALKAPKEYQKSTKVSHIEQIYDCG